MKSKRLARILLIVFIFAVVMGAGPGIYLVNPDASDPDASRFFLGMPIVYVWAVAWFSIQATCVVIAYFTLWREVSPETGAATEEVEKGGEPS